MKAAGEFCRPVSVALQSARSLALAQARVISFTLSAVDVIAFWGINVTDADVIMGDGKSLEKKGNADETASADRADLAAKRDPVLARAAELAV